MLNILEIILLELSKYLVYNFINISCCYDAGPYFYFGSVCPLHPTEIICGQGTIEREELQIQEKCE